MSVLIESYSIKCLWLKIMQWNVLEIRLLSKKYLSLKIMQWNVSELKFYYPGNVFSWKLCNEMFLDEKLL